ncbi:FHA domain containing protein [Cylindrospermum sp. NIES-4074]|nr:FHA domain containing protein [Cylindrospermum sp. NIES-4074]
MHELILTWTEEAIAKSEKIQEQQPSKNPGTVRIGRDPAQCDIVITHPTVSALHVEIFFNPQMQSFYLRNLRPTNPPVVDKISVIEGEVPLQEGSSIYLGQMEFKVVAVSGTEKRVAPTIVNPHQLSTNVDVNQSKESIKIDIDENKISGMVADIVNTDYFQQLQQLAHKSRNKSAKTIEAGAKENPIQVEQEASNVGVSKTPPTRPPETDADGIYGSMCLNCHQIAPYKRDLWCTYCGTSMATATKVLVKPRNQ